MTLLLALNISDGIWPPYASQMITEIYQVGEDLYAVRILYNGKVMKLPFCENKEMCDVERVRQHLAKFEPESVEKNCQPSAKGFEKEM